MMHCCCGQNKDHISPTPFFLSFSSIFFPTHSLRLFVSVPSTCSSPPQCSSSLKKIMSNELCREVNRFHGVPRGLSLHLVFVHFFIVSKEHFPPLVGHSNSNYMAIISIMWLTKHGEFNFFVLRKCIGWKQKQ